MLKDIGSLNLFIDIEVLNLFNGLLLSHRKYIQEILVKAKMQDAKPLPMPMVSGQQLSAYVNDLFSIIQCIDKLLNLYNMSQSPIQILHFPLIESVNICIVLFKIIEKILKEYYDI